MKRIHLLPLAAGLLFGAQGICADYSKETVPAKTAAQQPQIAATDLIGKRVTNAQDENLGKVQDVIINLEQRTAPCVVVASGGLLGANRSRIAVPFDALQCSADGSHLLISATKEQFQAASPTATGEWAPVAHLEWASKVDGFYGQPKAIMARDGGRDDSSRSFVRDPLPKGAEVLMTAQDGVLCERICESVDEVVHIRVNNGVTHLYGQVPDEEARQKLEAKVRSVPGVRSVQSHLKVKTP